MYPFTTYPSCRGDFPDGSGGKEPTFPCRGCGFSHQVGKMPWRKKQQPTQAFLPGESHGGRSLAGCNPCGHKEPDTTKQLNNNYKRKACFGGEQLRLFEIGFKASLL